MAIILFRPHHMLALREEGEDSGESIYELRVETRKQKFLLNFEERIKGLCTIMVHEFLSESG